jgi:hypothetical protein
MSLEANATTYIEVIRGLHESWAPHPGQVEVGRAIFNEGKKSVFVQCGRKWGKTEIAAYICWRIAQAIPNSPCYFIGPEQKQTREIVWANKRIQNFGPREWLLDGSEGINQTEMRLRFKNGSFIKVDGSDNHDSYRGPEYKVCIYEEFKDQKKEFRDAMRPNAAVLDGIDVFIGSPPDGDEISAAEYLETAEEHRSDPRKMFKQAPTWENPRISAEWLFDEKTRLYKRGDGDVWEREYGANIVFGGKASIFPMIHDYPITPHRQLVHEISRDIKKLKWFAIADPGSATCFAVLFGAINPYTKRIYLLDEIYENEPSRTTTNLVGAGIVAKEAELGRGRADWHEVCDEAARWFINEMGAQFDRWFSPTAKAQNDKKDGLSLIKDCLLAGLVSVSDRCTNLVKEMKGYKRSANGQIPKKDDHLIDCFRYLLAADGYELHPEREPLAETERDDFRGATPEQDYGDIRADEF